MSSAETMLDEICAKVEYFGLGFVQIPNLSMSRSIIVMLVFGIRLKLFQRAIQGLQQVRAVKGQGV